MLSRERFVIEFRGFVEGLGRDRSAAGIGVADNLFDAGVLDSFTVVKVIVFIEELTGSPVDLEEASIESFSTMESIFTNFVAGRDVPACRAVVDAVDVRRAAR
jgi:acyl carrier protein